MTSLARSREDLGGCHESASGLLCGADRHTCDSNGYRVHVDDVDVARQVAVGGDVDAPEGGVNFRIDQLDTKTSETTELGYTCGVPGDDASSPAAAPEVITVTQSDFAELPVAPLQAHAGPERGWVPVTMEVVLYVNADEQIIKTTLLDTPVRIRAIPVEYHWDLGDGNTITTDKPGEPYPSMEVAGMYRYEGWYDVTLTTTFIGQFSVDGGAWQGIDGSIEVESDPVEIFSKSLESRLVAADTPVDEEEDPWMPQRTDETEGPLDPEASDREI